MANTYTQIHIQFVFAVKYREGLIHSSFKEELYQYISGIIKANNHKLLAINGMSDHIHILNRNASNAVNFRIDANH